MLFKKEKTDPVKAAALGVVKAEQALDELRAQRAELLAARLEAEDQGQDVAAHDARLQEVSARFEMQTGRVSHRRAKLVDVVMAELKSEIRNVSARRAEYKLAFEERVRLAGELLVRARAAFEQVGEASAVSALDALLNHPLHDAVEPSHRPILIEGVRRGLEALAGDELPNLPRLRSDLLAIETLPQADAIARSDPAVQRRCSRALTAAKNPSAGQSQGSDGQHLLSQLLARAAGAVVRGGGSEPPKDRATRWDLGRRAPREDGVYQ